MWAQVRSQELTGMTRGRRLERASPDARQRAGALRLLETYAGLARRGEHLIGALLAGQHPRQWSHYPENDAIDLQSGFQWFYHSHAPEDGRDAAEHGHIHLFARRARWSRRLRSAREIRFATLQGDETAVECDTRHLLAIGFDAKGLPSSLFTVNSWVTGDLMLSAQTTAALLAQMTLETGMADVDAVLASVVLLYREEIRALLEVRDKTLFGFKEKGVLANESLEVLSELAVDPDTRLAAVLQAGQ